MRSEGPAERARQEAARILETRWEAVRYGLELEEERWTPHRLLGREVYQARFRVWERAGDVLVDVDRRGGVTRVRSPAPPEDEVEEEAAQGSCAAVPDAAREAALEAARSAAPARPVRVRDARRGSPRRGGDGFRFTIERAPEDGRVVIDLDPRDGARLGYLCAPFFRGSTRSAALQRSSALARAQTALDLPPEARLTRARLVTGRLGRAWRLRWEVAGPDREGVVVASLNARSGVPCVSMTALAAPKPPLAGRPPREEAEAELRLGVRVRLGPEARVGDLVPGALRGGQNPRAAWFAAVRHQDGRLFRAALEGGRLRLRRCG